MGTAAGSDHDCLAVGSDMCYISRYSFYVLLIFNSAVIAVICSLYCTIKLSLSWPTGFCILLTHLRWVWGSCVNDYLGLGCSWA